jgi:phage tail P2-like protein
VTLLPPNATSAERAVDAALARLSDVPVVIRELWNADTCPEPLLPYLAWALSVDVWDAAWPIARKRSAIRSAWSLHRLKGTRKAVSDAVASVGGAVVLREWFEQSPEGVPGTFQAVVAGGGATVTAEYQNQLIAAIERAKPASRHFTVGTGIDMAGAIGMAGVLRAWLFTRLELTD